MTRAHASRLVVALSALLIAAVITHAAARLVERQRDAYAWCVHDWQELADRYCN